MDTLTFPNLDVVQYETRENIYKAFLVLFCETSAIVDAILLKKRILYLTSNFFSKNVNSLGRGYVYKAGLLEINTKDEIKIDKNIILRAHNPNFDDISIKDTSSVLGVITQRSGKKRILLQQKKKDKHTSGFNINGTKTE